ncbi:MAG: magnesium-protoporphyrin IX monomethyl ester (oxidative) cyclase [Myxococcota bacterium]
MTTTTATTKRLEDEDEIDFESYEFEYLQVTQAAQETSTLSPRFYTTDVDAMMKFGIEPIRDEWNSLMAEYKADKNKFHFERDESFDANEMEPALRKEVVDFMTSSLTSEFSGCLLYAELKKKGKNDDLTELFRYMARDEARHAGFINKCLKDFDVQVDMKVLKREKDYTYFSPKFILYATYLSEKIGYARYITIFRHLERHPENRFHPIFNKFEEWCNDEFRHGESLALMMRANPSVLEGLNRYWIRFFQVAVFCTMFVRDHTRPEFYRALGVEPEDYGMEVFRITRDISRQCFPVLVDVDNPRFLQLLRRLRSLAEQIDQHQKRGFFGKLRALPLKALVVITFLRVLMMKPLENPLPTEMRVAPSW